jgi:Domain of unknown function (DUF3859)
MTIRAITMAILLSMFSSAAIGQTIKRVEIVEFGIYSVKVEKSVSAVGAASGYRNELSNERLVTATDTMPARLGVNFGFRYQIIGNNGATVTLKKVTLIPQPGIQNPKTGDTKIRGEISFERVVGGKYYTGFGFDDSWEVVPGIWTIELWDGDRKLASQSFNLVKP